jgi:hypothetical protein
MHSQPDLKTTHGASQLREEPRLKPEILARLKEMGALGARIPPAAVSIPFRLMSVLGALIASLFVLAYIALIPLAGWATYRLASAFGSVSVGSLSALLGCALILSLLKPLVAPSGRGPEPHLLDAEEEPLLFAFVKELSSSGGLPMPSHIAVDCSVNCHCVFSGGITGILRSDFVLVIGLPLAAGLRLDQFAGALAHELSHAAQTRVVRSSRIIWSVHAWFSRVALERDRLDEQLLKYVVTGRSGVRLASRGSYPKSVRGVRGL